MEDRGTPILLKLQADPKLVREIIVQLHENKRPVEPVEVSSSDDIEASRLSA